MASRNRRGGENTSVLHRALLDTPLEVMETIARSMNHNVHV
jgi:hypothetical protein